MSKKIRIFQVHPGDRTYQGSIWDTPVKPWIPSGAKQLTEFEVDAGMQWMSVTEDEYQDIQKSKMENAKDQGKIIISPEKLIRAIKEYSFLVKGDKEELCVNIEDIKIALAEL